MKTKLQTILMLLVVFALNVKAVSNAGKPGISVAEITSVTTNSATLLIGINANVAEATINIQYNTSGNFTQPFSTFYVGKTAGMVNFTPTITNLALA